MRGERDREGFELSLDVRELVSVALGLLVVLGLVFYLGVAVGKDLGRGQAPAPTSLDALDAVAEAPEVKPEELTFPEVLTEPELVVEEEPEPRAEVAPREAAREVAQASEAAKKAEAPAKAKTPEPAAAQEREAAAPAVAPEVSADSPLFVVQVASFPNKQEADAMVKSLRERNLSASVVEAEIPGRGIYYRVRVGRFSDRDAAKRYQEDLLRETGLEGFVVAAGD